MEKPLGILTGVYREPLANPKASCRDVPEEAYEMLRGELLMPEGTGSLMQGPKRSHRERPETYRYEKSSGVSWGPRESEAAGRPG